MVSSPSGETSSVPTTATRRVATSKMSIQAEDSLSKMVPLSPDEPCKVAHVGNSLDPKKKLTLIKFL
jgi:hypothetical protein